MTKIRKQKKKKSFNYGMSRKRINKKRYSAPHSHSIKNELSLNLSNKKKFEEMGIAFDVNEDIKKCKDSIDAAVFSDLKDEVPEISELNERKRTKSKNVNMSEDQKKYLSYLVEKYGDDFVAMAKDKKNYLQETSNQLRRKVRKFKMVLQQQACDSF